MITNMNICLQIYQILTNVNKCQQILGEASLKKNEKIWDNVPIRVDPSPPSDIWDIFEFQTFLKKVDPLPSDQIETFLNVRHFLQR